MALEVLDPQLQLPLQTQVLLVSWKWDGGLLELQVLLESLELLVGPKLLVEVETMEPEEGVGRSSGPLELSQVVLAVVQVLLIPQVAEAVLYPVPHQVPSAQ